MENVASATNNAAEQTVQLDLLVPLGSLETVSKWATKIRVSVESTCIKGLAMRLHQSCAGANSTPVVAFNIVSSSSKSC